LSQCELNVASAWREVNDKIVKFTPRRLSNKLGHEIRNHGPSHNSSFVLRSEAIRHSLNASEFDRHDLGRVFLVLVDVRRIWLDHRRQAWAVDVSVENSNFKSHLIQRVRQVNSNGRLADTSLATRDSQDVLNVFESGESFVHRFIVAALNFLRCDRDVHLRDVGQQGLNVLGNDLLVFSEIF